MNPRPPALARDLNQGFQQQVRVGVSGAQVGAGPHAGRIIVGAQTDFLFAQPAHDSGGIDDATVGPVGGETHQPGSWGLLQQGADAGELAPTLAKGRCVVKDRRQTDLGLSLGLRQLQRRVVAGEQGCKGVLEALEHGRGAALPTSILSVTGKVAMVRPWRRSSSLQAATTPSCSASPMSSSSPACHVSPQRGSTQPDETFR
jgi:hypothetical protein